MLEAKNIFVECVNSAGRPVKAVNDVSFGVPEGRLFTLLGPSHCGKTTTMRAIVDLERPCCRAGGNSAWRWHARARLLRSAWPSRVTPA